MSELTPLTGLEAMEARDVLLWFARQAEAVQLEILELKRMREADLAPYIRNHPAEALELAALLLTSLKSGYEDELAYRTSRTISREASQGITGRRKARAAMYAAHRMKVRQWLGRNWGKVVDMRGAHLSWRRIAAMIEDEHGLRISHTALRQYWRAWNE